MKQVLEKIYPEPTILTNSLPMVSEFKDNDFFIIFKALRNDFGISEQDIVFSPHRINANVFAEALKYTVNKDNLNEDNFNEELHKIQFLIINLSNNHLISYIQTPLYNEEDYYIGAKSIMLNSAGFAHQETMDRIIKQTEMFFKEQDLFISIKAITLNYHQTNQDLNKNLDISTIWTCVFFETLLKEFLAANQDIDKIDLLKLGSLTAAINIEDKKITYTDLYQKALALAEQEEEPLDIFTALYKEEDDKLQSSSAAQYDISKNKENIAPQDSTDMAYFAQRINNFLFKAEYLITKNMLKKLVDCLSVNKVFTGEKFANILIHLVVSNHHLIDQEVVDLLTLKLSDDSWSARGYSAIVLQYVALHHQDLDTKYVVKSLVNNLVNQEVVVSDIFIQSLYFIQDIKHGPFRSPATSSLKMLPLPATGDFSQSPQYQDNQQLVLINTVFALQELTSSTDNINYLLHIVFQIDRSIAIPSDVYSKIFLNFLTNNLGIYLFINNFDPITAAMMSLSYASKLLYMQDLLANPGNINDLILQSFLNNMLYQNDHLISEIAASSILTGMSVHNTYQQNHEQKTLENFIPYVIDGVVCLVALYYHPISFTSNALSNIRNTGIVLSYVVLTDIVTKFSLEHITSAPATLLDVVGGYVDFLSEVA